MNKSFFSVRRLCLMAILSAISAIVMLLEFSVPLIPSFYELDFSDIFVLIGGFLLGPIEAIIIMFLKVVINTCFNGTSTAFVGEIANFVVGCSFVVPASVIYRFNKTKKGAIIGLIVGTLSLVLVGCLANYFVLLPLYIRLYFGGSQEALIGVAAKANSNIKGMGTFMLYAPLPFNLLKGVVDSLITLVVYKKISPFLRKQLDR